MASKRKLKLDFSDSEDYDSKSESDNEPDISLKRPTKKKRVFLDSGSENESDCLEDNFLKNSEKSDGTSDEDKPLKNKREKLKVHTSANILNDKPLAANNKNSSIYSDDSKESSTLSSLSDAIRPEDTSDDDKPISDIIKKKASELKEKSKANYSSDSSEEKPIANKYKEHFDDSNDQNDESEDELVATSEKREIIDHKATSTKFDTLDSSSCNSDDEPIKSRKSRYLKTNKMIVELDSETDKPKSEVTSDEEPLNKIKTSKTNGNSKAHSSASDSEEKYLTVKNKSSKQKSKDRRDKNKSVTKGGNTSSDEELKSKMVRGSKILGKLQKKHNSSISSDDEPLANKITANQKAKQQENSDLSSDDEEKHLSSSAKLSKEVSKKKVKNSSNAKIEHLKKYLRVAGIHVNNYDKLFQSCKSIKSKTEKLLGLLHEKGLKGRPTIEKCKKLKKKIETKKEIAELDMSNIIKSEGRSRRGTGGKIQKNENSPAAKKFVHLQDIIESEESD